jgi:hypothetical protein
MQTIHLDPILNMTGIPAHPSMDGMVLDPDEELAQKFYDLSWFNGEFIPCFEEVESRIEEFVDLAQNLMRGEQGRVLIECEAWLNTRLSQALFDKGMVPCSSFWAGKGDPKCIGIIPHFED